jgi:DNA-binding MarR family transcriptional regulator
MLDKEIPPIDIEKFEQDVMNKGWIKFDYNVLIKEYGLSLNEAVLFCFIYNYNEQGRHCKVSQKQIANLLGLSRNTVNTVLQKLEGLGLLNKIVTYKDGFKFVEYQISFITF